MPRRERVAQAIKKEVSLILHDQLKDPRIGFVTVVEVELSQDLRHAKVFYSVLGGEAAYKKTQKALDSASGFIRTRVAETIQLRFAPEIIFRPDHSGEYSSRIDQVLQQIKDLHEPHTDSSDDKKE